MDKPLQEFKENIEKFASSIKLGKGYKQGYIYVLLNALQSGDKELFIDRFLRLLNAFPDNENAVNCMKSFFKLLPLSTESFKNIGYLIVSALMGVEISKEGE